MIVEEQADPGGSPVSGRPAAKRGSRGYWRPGLIALTFLILCALVINYAGLDHTQPRVLHGRDVEIQLGEDLQALQGRSVPPDVSCPASEPVRQGLQFTCTVQGGTKLSVTEIDGRGEFNYRVLTP